MTGDALGPRSLDIVNQKGLHARASAKFAETVERFDASASVSKGGQTVPGDSIMGLLLLTASQGTSIEVVTRGNEADALMDAITTLVSTGFGERD